MARPQKEGVDYFPLDVHLDDKVELIEAEFGLVGFGVVVKLWQKIYAKQGYYIEWTKEVALLFAKSVGLGDNAVSEIVVASIRRGLFDGDMYDKYSILTSIGIQKRYFEMMQRRKNVTVKNQYLLVDLADFSINANINFENVSRNSKKDDNNPQSKVKETKVNKTKKNNVLMCGFDSFWKAYPKKVGKGAAEASWNKIKPADKLAEVILIAVDKATESEQWTIESGRFIPNPATWLNQKRWEDELPPAQPKAANTINRLPDDGWSSEREARPVRRGNINWEGAE